MAVKIRLQRHGKKGKPFFHIVVASSRAKRDGKFIEKIGSYNSITNPATIVLDLDKAVSWLEKGAQPSDTVRCLLSYKGAMLKKHLNGGVKKGAFTAEEAEKKFAEWLESKEKTIQTKKDGLSSKLETNKKERLEAEKKVNEARVSAEKAAIDVANKVDEEVDEEVDEIVETVEETVAEVAEENQAEEASNEETPQA